MCHFKGFTQSMVDKISSKTALRPIHFCALQRLSSIYFKPQKSREHDRSSSQSGQVNLSPSPQRTKRKLLLGSQRTMFESSSVISCGGGGIIFHFGATDSWQFIAGCIDTAHVGFQLSPVTYR